MEIKNKTALIVALLLLAMLLAACNQTTGNASALKGQVTVTTDPDGVVVTLTPKDGGGNVVSLGETPVLNRLVAPGRYVLTLQKEGYQTFSVGVEVKSDVPIEVSYQLNELSQNELEAMQGA